MRIQLRRGTSAQWAAANPVLAAGEPGVDLDTDVLKIGDGVTAWATLPYQGSIRRTITPDDFAGATDGAKLQAAVVYCVANDFPVIVINRWLDLTGAAPISIDKTPWYDKRIVYIMGGGGGIEKNSAGAVFTSAVENTGNVNVQGVKFQSTAGVGAIVWDADKLLRFSSSHCEYRQWDLVVSQTVVGRWCQSMRFHKEHIIGGAGPAFLMRETYDCTFNDILIEDRPAGIWNSDAALAGYSNRNLRITSSLFENMAGVPIKLGGCWSTLISGNYFEENGAVTDPQIDLWTLSQGSYQVGVVLEANMFSLRASQVAAKSTPAILHGRNYLTSQVVSIGNVASGGVLHKFGHATAGEVLGSRGDYVEGGDVVFAGQETRYVNPAAVSGSTTFRPKNPRIGVELYYDTTLALPIWAKTAGTKAYQVLRLTAGASSSGNVTVTLATVPFTVAVTAGDTLTQVRNKIVAAPFYPWTTSASSTDIVRFDALRPGLITNSPVFNGGTTGVTSDYFGLDGPGTNPTWINAAGTTV